MFQQQAGQQAWQEAAPALTPRPMSLANPLPPFHSAFLPASHLRPLLPILSTSFSPLCCISHPLCPLYLVPFPPSHVPFLLPSLSLSPQPMPGHSAAEEFIWEEPT